MPELRQDRKGKRAYKEIMKKKHQPNHQPKRQPKKLPNNTENKPFQKIHKNDIKVKQPLDCQGVSGKVGKISFNRS